MPENHFYIHTGKTELSVLLLYVQTRHRRRIKIFPKRQAFKIHKTFSLESYKILEIAKLYNKSNSDKFNLNKFINNLKPAGIFSEMKVDESVIKEWENMINDEKTLIKKIVDLRNKLYAHTDEELGELTNEDIYFGDLERLIEFTESIMKKIYLDVLDATLDVRTPTFNRGKRFGWIKILAKARRKSLERYFRADEG